MRKILIAVLIVLLIVLAYFTIFQGISIGTFQILSTRGIVELNDRLTNEIEEANTKIKSDLQNRKAQLSESVQTLLENKEAYYNLANVSTDTQITEASTEETYNIEYLWLRIGRHARSEGVNIKMDVINGNSAEANMKDLSFTVVGQYAAIIEFVSALEDDSQLNFRIDGFSMLPSGENLEATFEVKDVRIKMENTTQSVDGTSTGTTSPTNTEDTTNTEDIANTESATTDTTGATDTTTDITSDVDTGATGTEE